ncbi:MAG: hypothetical protein J7518_20410 [Nocardioidaceae bacterium]|nr:hypothetical protein [Nocardioidaceae bacterium]
MADDRYARITWRGHTFDRYTVAALEAVEADIGRTLTIYQGSFNTSVSESAGTHAGGGAVDCWCDDLFGLDTARALRRRGFAAWYRPELTRNGKRIWGAHVHAVQIGNLTLSVAAAAQVSDYRGGRNGLADNAPDPDPWRPNPIEPFDYEEDNMTPAQFVEMLKDPGVRQELRDIFWGTPIDSSTATSGKRKASGMLTSIEREAAK